MDAQVFCIGSNHEVQDTGPSRCYRHPFYACARRFCATSFARRSCLVATASPAPATRPASRATAAGNGTAGSSCSPIRGSRSCASPSTRRGAAAMWGSPAMNSTPRPPTATSTRSRSASTSAACGTYGKASPTPWGLRPRASRRSPPSPASAVPCGPTRCAARSGLRPGGSGRSPAGSMRRCILRNGTTLLATRPIRCTSALTWSSRAIGVVLALLAARPPGRLSAQVPAPTIDTIIVVSRNVFDFSDEAPGFLARLANRLHVTTRPGVVRRALLVNPGDRYDSARVAESERALRNLHVFSRVRIDTTRLDGRLALRVATTDGWSTKPQLGYSSAGGDVTWLAGMVEDNLLGTATSLTAVYNKTPDRSIFDLGYVSPHFFSRRAQLQAGYKDKSDGTTGTWVLGVPFYATATRRAGATRGSGSAGSGGVRTSRRRRRRPRSPARCSAPWARGWTWDTCGSRCSSGSTRMRDARMWTCRSCSISASGRPRARGDIRRRVRAGGSRCSAGRAAGCSRRAYRTRGTWRARSPSRARTCAVRR